MARFADSRPAVAAALMLGVGAVLAGSGRQAWTQAPVFRASTDAVWVTATATDREGRLVIDLGGDDFEVIEDGVVQPITVFRSDPVPVAVSIMFDLSGSLGDSVGTMRRAMTELIDRFRPGDRANVGSFDSLPSVSPRFSSNRETLLRSTATMIGAVSIPCRGPWNAALERQQTRGASGIWDAVACGIDTVAGDAETPRRVVLLITDGYDNMSITGQAEVQALANTYGVMVYVIAMVGTEGLNSGGLRALAAETGGGYYVLNQQDDLTPTFTRIADELRHQYVLGYSAPAGGAPRGKLEVRVKRPGITARGRRATMTVLPVASAVTEAIQAERDREAAAIRRTSGPSNPFTDTVFDRSVRNALRPEDLPTLSLSALRNAVSGIKKNGLAWIRADGALQEQARTVQLATFVLDFLSRQDVVRYWRNDEAAIDLLAWTSARLRAGPPQPAERLWYLAGIALLQRFGASGELETHLTFARARFPDEPRFVLAHAVAAEMRVWPQRRDEAGFAVSEDVLLSLLRRYASALDVASVRQEAHIRLGYFELLRGRDGEALKHFDQAGAPGDEMLRYTLDLFRGQALMSAGRPGDAIAAFERALDVVPFAQSATIGLGAALVISGRHNEAEALVTRMLTLPSAPFDPWTIHTFPEWRYWAQWMVELRRAGGS